MSEEVKLLPATPDLILRALTDGGRAAVTVRSKESGQRVSIVLSVRKRNGEKGWVSRATKAGRVGILEGDVVEARDPSVEYPDNYVGRFYLDKRAWRAGREADPIRTWTAEKILQFALAGNPVLGEKANVLLATTCWPVREAAPRPGVDRAAYGPGMFREGDEVEAGEGAGLARRPPRRGDPEPGGRKPGSADPAPWARARASGGREVSGLGPEGLGLPAVYGLRAPGRPRGEVRDLMILGYLDPAAPAESGGPDVVALVGLGLGAALVTLLVILLVLYAVKR